MKGQHLLWTVVLVIGLLFVYHQFVQQKGNFTTLKQSLGINR